MAGPGNKPTLSGCPKCGSEHLSGTDGAGRIYICDGCEVRLVKHLRKGPFGDTPYFLPVNRPGLENVVQRPKSGEPHIIETE